jgi:hypothetical protein
MPIHSGIATLDRDRRPASGAVKSFQAMSVVTEETQDVPFSMVYVVVSALPAAD